MKKILSLTLLVTLLVACSTQPPKDPIEQKIEELLSQMTIEEKIGQLNQATYPCEDVKDAIKAGNIGSFLNAVDVKEVNELQRIAVEESRLHIPILFSRDVIHGFKTIFPIPLGQAASFDTALVRACAEVAADEATSVGVRWTFSPMVDIARDARWGRIAEGYGEDPVLASAMGSATIQGYQSHGMAACVKHFVAYGAVEGGRDYNSTGVSEQQLRNTYLPPFKAAVDAHAWTLMTSFNDNDGVPSTANKYLLKNILRDEWRWDGMVVTDWCSASEMIVHGFAEDREDAAAKSFNAGVDMDMVSRVYIENIKSLHSEGVISMHDIDNAVRNVLKVKFRVGLFDNPYIDESLSESVLYNEEHLELARKAAASSAILLKNEGILPLKQDLKILLTGPLADAPHDQLGTWSFDGEKEYSQTPLDALKKEYGDRLTYIPTLTYSRDENVNSVDAVIRAARSTDVIVVCLGEEAILSGEAHCLADLNLKGAQSELINTLSKIGKPIISVVFAGRPLTIKGELEQSDAMLYLFSPGTMGGPALADLLTGKVVPSGKTPVTFPLVTGQVPIYYNHNNTGRPIVGNEVLLDAIPIEAGQTSLGCTSFYLDAGWEPLFPFGYGLSYTTFSYSQPKLLSPSELQETDTLRVSCVIKNTGNFDADEVVQLYVRDLVGSITRPIAELKAFKKEHIKAGESVEVDFVLPISDLAFWTQAEGWHVEKGNFKLWVGCNSNCTSGEGAIDFKIK